MKQKTREIIERINVGCGIINIILYPIIFGISLMLPIANILKILIMLITIYYIMYSIKVFQQTKYKIYDADKIIK